MITIPNPTHRLLVCGSRNFNSYETVEYIIKSFLTKYNIECIIEGEARGADTFGRMVGEKFNIPVVKCHANWDIHGKSAGIIRNQQMLDEEPTYILAFSDDIYNSNGTKHMISISKNAGIQGRLFNSKKELIERW